MTKLNTFVHVVEAGENGRQATFGPGDRLPAWAIAAIDNPKVWAVPPTDRDLETARERDRGLAPGPDGSTAGVSAGGQQLIRQAEARADDAEARATTAETELARLRRELDELRAAPPAASTATSGDVTVQEPPRGGPGSGEKAWREFLTGQGIQIPAGASREDLHALWDQRKS